MRFVYALLLPLLLVQCRPQNTDYQAAAADPSYLHQSVEKLTTVIVHDIFSPPVASRVYTYAIVAAYEAMRPGHPAYATLAGQLNGLTPPPAPATDQEYCYPLAALHAYLAVGRTLIFSEERLEVWQQQVYDHYRQLGVPDEVFERSVAYGQQVADHVLAWSKEDGYAQTRGLRHTVSDEDGTWKPTPPAYMDGVEPFWSKVRPFVLDSAGQFAPGPPTPFDPHPESAFMTEVRQVYQTVNGLSDEQRAIASFWDCNPFVMNTTGHVMFATKKITPGGHWQGITAIACQQQSLDMMPALEAYARVSVAIADAFISCWEEKYRSNYIRPETAINQYLDDGWEPTLQTPPFPEYPSGHSVISTAAGEVLTSLFGDNFAYTDTTELAWGLPPRQFTSFRQAADEAAVSRLYGGIHFMPAIRNGQEEGRQVGQFVDGRLQTRRPQMVRR